MTPVARGIADGKEDWLPSFSDLRHIIAKAALSDDFNAVCNNKQKLTRKSFVGALLRLVA